MGRAKAGAQHQEELQPCQRYTLTRWRDPCHTIAATALFMPPAAS